MTMGRTIRQVFLERGDADDVCFYLKQHGFNPKVYARMARAEGLTVRVWVIVCDAPDFYAASTVDKRA
jgi:hypothetical protein